MCHMESHSVTFSFAARLHVVTRKLSDVGKSDVNVTGCDTEQALRRNDRTGTGGRG